MKTSGHRNNLILNFQPFFLMITEIIKLMFRLNKLIVIFAIFLISCHSLDKCNEVENGTLLQQFHKGDNVFSLWQINSGVYGKTVVFKICNRKSNLLIEEIGIRGEDFIPRVDSIKGNDIYISYLELGSESTDYNQLDFKRVVLGDALLGKITLKYNYHFGSYGRFRD